MIEVVAQPSADERRVALIDLVGHQIVHHHAADESAEKPGPVPPARADQRLADADVPVRVVGIAVRKPGVRQPRVNEVVPRGRIRQVGSGDIAMNRAEFPCRRRESSGCPRFGGTTDGGCAADSSTADAGIIRSAGLGRNCGPQGIRRQIAHRAAGVA